MLIQLTVIMLNQAAMEHEEHDRPPLTAPIEKFARRASSRGIFSSCRTAWIDIHESLFGFSCEINENPELCERYDRDLDDNERNEMSCNAAKRM